MFQTHKSTITKLRCPDSRLRCKWEISSTNPTATPSSTRQTRIFVLVPGYAVQSTAPQVRSWSPAQSNSLHSGSERPLQRQASCCPTLGSFTCAAQNITSIQNQRQTYNRPWKAYSKWPKNAEFGGLLYPRSQWVCTPTRQRTLSPYWLKPPGSFFLK